jgi:general stress protein YciG
MKLSRRQIGRSGKSSNHDVHRAGDIGEKLGADMPKPARNSMTSYRRPDSFAHDQSESRFTDAEDRACIITPVSVDNQVVSSHSAASTHHARKICAVMQSVRLR